MLYHLQVTNNDLRLMSRNLQVTGSHPWTTSRYLQLTTRQVRFRSRELQVHDPLEGRLDPEDTWGRPTRG